MWYGTITVVTGTDVYYLVTGYDFAFNFLKSEMYAINIYSYLK
jgi:hypothetical protein